MDVNALLEELRAAARGLPPNSGSDPTRVVVHGAGGTDRDIEHVQVRYRDGKPYIALWARSGATTPGCPNDA